MIKSLFSVAFVSLLLFSSSANAQNDGGIGVSPTKLYYELQPGETKTVKVTVTNKSPQPHTFEATFADWERDSIGNKLYYAASSRPNSCSNWVVAIPSLFELKVMSRKTL